MSERHEHEWVRDEQHDGIRAWACAECPETSATCGTCEGPSGTSLLLCRRCQGRADLTLDRIARALELIPGGAGGRSDGVHFRRPRIDDDDSEPGPRESVEDILWGWVARWKSSIESQRAS